MDGEPAAAGHIYTAVPDRHLLMTEVTCSGSAGRDASPKPSRRVSLGEAGGRGLSLIDPMAAGWGSIPHWTGKTVWATLHTSR